MSGNTNQGCYEPPTPEQLKELQDALNYIWDGSITFGKGALSGDDPEMQENIKKAANAVKEPDGEESKAFIDSIVFVGDNGED